MGRALSGEAELEGILRVGAGTAGRGIMVGFGLEGGEQGGEAIFRNRFPRLGGSHIKEGFVGKEQRIA